MIEFKHSWDDKAFESIMVRMWRREVLSHDLKNLMNQWTHIEELNVNFFLGGPKVNVRTHHDDYIKDEDGNKVYRHVFILQGTDQSWMVTGEMVLYWKEEEQQFLTTVISKVRQYGYGANLDAFMFAARLAGFHNYETEEVFYGRIHREAAERQARDQAARIAKEQAAK